MKRTLGFVLLLAASCLAQAGERISLRELAEETNLTEKQVAMVLGPSFAYTLYRPAYVRSRAQFIRVYGRERYEELAAAYQDQLRKDART